MVSKSCAVAASVRLGESSPLPPANTPRTHPLLAESRVWLALMPLPPSEWWDTVDVVYPFCPMRMQYVASHSDDDVLGFHAAHQVLSRAGLAGDKDSYKVKRR